MSVASRQSNGPEGRSRLPQWVVSIHWWEWLTILGVLLVVWLLNAPGEPLEERIDYVFLVPGLGHAVRVINSRRVLNHPFEREGGWLWALDHIGLLTTVEIMAPK